jgi:hypothetical protein
MAATFTLTNTLQFVQPWVSFYPLTIGTNNQPFIGMCERVAQILMAPPFKPNWNRNTVNFVTTIGTQTYLNAGSWALGTNYTAGTVIIDPNGNGQVVIVAGASGGSAPSWSQTLFATTTDSTVTWQNVGKLAIIPQITDFAYIEKAAVQDINSVSAVSAGNAWKELGIKLNLPRDTTTSCPKFVAAQSDDNIGDIAIRLTPTPGSAYPVSVQYQKLHTPFTALSNLWAPIPDRMFYIYGFGVLALSYLYKGDQRYAWASQQFVAGVLSYYDGLEQTQINQFLQNWDATLADSTRAANASQGVQARGV